LTYLASTAILRRVNFDISQLLDDWEFQPGQVMVRKFTGQDGAEKLQLRLDLGLLQMNVEGRPDGKRPYGHDTLLAYYQAQKKRTLSPPSGSDGAFALQAEDCAELQLEAMQYHHRCLCLFQLESYNRAIEDAERNLEIFDFVAENAGADEMIWPLLQFRPQVLMMRTRAKSALALRANRYENAITVVEKGLEEIRQFYREQSRTDLLEHSDEIQVLEGSLKEIRAKRPLSKREKLEIALGEAVRREDYEKAAFFRDALRNLKASQS
jgi:tetratricopeptide (TPR) repeat protein